MTETFETPPGSCIKVVRNWLPTLYADNILKRIREEIPFYYYRRKSYNKEYDVPRGILMFGDREIANIYDGCETFDHKADIKFRFIERGSVYPIYDWDISLEKLLVPSSNYPEITQPMYQKIYSPRDPETYKGPSVGQLIKQLMLHFNAEMNLNYDSALINEYVDGNSYIASHYDQECLGANHSVLGISLGGSRDFYFHPRKDAPPEAKVIKTTLNHGDVLLMYGNTQNYYTHTIPRRAKAEYRASITFRSIANHK